MENSIAKNPEEENMKQAWSFLERRIQARYEKTAEELKRQEQTYQKNRQEMQELEPKIALLKERQSKLSMIEQMFRYGGEEIKLEEALAQEIEEKEERAAFCREGILLFESPGVREKEQFLRDVDFLKGQKNRLFGAKRREEKKPDKWDYKGKDATLQAAYFLLYYRYRISGPPDNGVNEIALFHATGDSFGDHLSLPEVCDLPMDAEKEAFCAVAARAFLELVLQQRGGLKTRAAAEKNLQRLNRVLALLPEKAALVPVVAGYRAIEKTGLAGIDDIVLLGSFYGYGLAGTSWLVCFRKAMENDAYHRVMIALLKAGFYKYLQFYDNAGEKCLKKVLGKWKGQERFAEYETDFQKGVWQYLNSEQCAKNLQSVLTAAKTEIPVKKYIIPWDVKRTEQLCCVCALELRENWLQAKLSPRFWENEWIEEKIRVLVYDQLRQYAGISRGSGKMAIYMADAHSTAKWLDLYFSELTEGKAYDGALDAAIRDNVLPAIMKNLQDVSRRAECKAIVKYAGRQRMEPYLEIMRENADIVMRKRFWDYVKLLNENEDDGDIWKMYEQEYQKKSNSLLGKSLWNIRKR